MRAAALTKTSAWHQVLPPLVLLLALVLVVYRDTAIGMVSIWARSDTFAHAFIVPPIAAWLIWRKRARLAAIAPHPSAWVLLLLAAVALVWLLGDLGAANSITQLAFTALLVLAVPALLGMAAARVMLFPLCFLFFAVPIGEFVMPQLMVWTADFTALALRISGIPVYREGMELVIPSGTWHIVEACSGVRYLMSSMMVGTLFAYLNFHALRRRLVFVGISILLPIVANWVRAYLIVLLGHVSDNRLAVGADHLIYGWVFFGMVMALMFVIGIRFAEPAPVHTTRPRDAAAAVATASANAAKAWAIAACGVALVVAPQLAAQALGAREAGTNMQLAAPLSLAGGWQLEPRAVADLKPQFRNASAEINSSYSSNGRHVGLYIAYYPRQDFEHKVVSTDNVLVKSNDPLWAEVSRGIRSLALADHAPITVRTTVLRPGPESLHGGDDRLVVWQTYWVNGRFTSSDQWAKFYGAFYRLMGRGDHAAAIVLYAPQASADGAPAALESFARQNLPAIGAHLSALVDGDREWRAVDDTQNTLGRRSMR